MAVCHHRDRDTLQAVVEARTASAAVVYPDAWQAYNHRPETGRGHARVCHTTGQRMMTPCTLLVSGNAMHCGPTPLIMPVADS